MKVVKCILKIIGGVLACVILLLLLNYVRLIVSYHINKNKFEDAFSIQGNRGNYIPQGMTYDENTNVVLQTSYNHNHTLC